MENKLKKGNAMDAFIEGGRNGWNIGVHSTLPNVLMAFALIRVLDILGLLSIIERVFAPVMMIVGLPGAAAAVLMAAVMSMGGAVGVAVGLLTTGALQEGRHIAILLPSIYLMGSLIQYIGRVCGTIEIPPKYYTHLIIISIVVAFLCMFVMNLIV
ncbi:MAG: YjiG family protein [Treponema sp.]|nr:YjiG family protein [Treponema sp.]